MFVMVILMPAATLIIWVFTERWSWPDLWPQTFSLRAVREITGRKGQLISLLGSSIFISVVVAFLSVGIGVMTARALVFYEFRGKRFFHFVSMLPFLVPATVFAMGIQVSFIKVGLNNSVMGVVIAHLIYSLPYAVRLLLEGTRAVGQTLEEQARVLGASSGKAFLKISFPLLVPVMLTGFSMAYVVSFSQYFLTLLIGGGKIKTFAIVMVPYLQSGNRNIASVYGGLFLGVTLIVFGVTERLAGKYSKKAGGEYYG